MADKAATGSRARSRRVALPPRVAAQAQALVEELTRLDVLREQCDMRQMARKHAGDQSYSTAEDNGDVLSYDEYRKFMDDYEAEVRKYASNAAIAIAERAMKQRDREAVAASGG